MRKLVVALAAASLVLAGCGAGEDEATVTVTSTMPASSSEETSTSATSTTAESDNEAETSEAAEAQNSGGCVAGYTEAPGQVDPHCLDKAIASCGDANLHQQGTTFFTDGTSGWTAQCAAQMVPSGGQSAPNAAPNYQTDDGGAANVPQPAAPPVYEEPSYEEPSGGAGGGGAPELPDGAGGGLAGY